MSQLAQLLSPLTAVIMPTYNAEILLMKKHGEHLPPTDVPINSTVSRRRHFRKHREPLPPKSVPFNPVLSRRRLLALSALTLLGNIPELEFLIPVPETFRSSAAWGRVLSYSKDKAKFNRLVCLGDSNMVGGMDPAPISFANVLKDTLAEKDMVWLLENYSVIGASTQDTIQNQINNPDNIAELNVFNRFDTCINVGGDNLLNIVDTQQKADTLTAVANDPFGLQNIGATWNIMGEVLQDMGTFRENFHSLLKRPQELYGNKIEHVFVISAPDFSKAPAISTTFEDGSVRKFKLDNDILKLFAHNVSILLNNNIAAAVDAFSTEHPEIPITIINIFDGFGRKCFGDDIHFSPKGKKKIVEKILACMELRK